jgi:hypothetical protein
LLLHESITPVLILSLFSPQIFPQCNQNPTNRLIQDSPVLLLKCARAAQADVAQSRRVKRPENL